MKRRWRDISDPTWEIGVETATPEHALLLAILERAVCDAIGNMRESNQAKKRLVGRKAEFWILTGDVDHPFSCPWICEGLNIDIEVMRRFIRKREWKIGKKGTSSTLLDRVRLCIDEPYLT